MRDGETKMSESMCDELVIALDAPFSDLVCDVEVLHLVVATPVGEELVSESDLRRETGKYPTAQIRGLLADVRPHTHPTMPAGMPAARP